MGRAFVLGYQLICFLADGGVSTHTLCELGNGPHLHPPAPPGLIPPYSHLTPTTAIPDTPHVHRETRQQVFLQTARRCADAFLIRMPEDGVPPWDFDAPPEFAHKDTSAGAIAAAGLLELDSFMPKGNRTYFYAAQALLSPLLAPPYLATRPYPVDPPVQPTTVTTREGGVQHDSLLGYGTYNYWRQLTGVGQIWGDYYFLQAIARYRDRVAALCAAGEISEGCNSFRQTRN